MIRLSYLSAAISTAYAVRSTDDDALEVREARARRWQRIIRKRGPKHKEPPRPRIEKPVVPVIELGEPVCAAPAPIATGEALWHGLAPDDLARKREEQAALLAEIDAELARREAAALDEDGSIARARAEREAQQEQERLDMMAASLARQARRH